MPPLTGFIGPSGTTRSPTASAERTLNLYVEQVESQRGTYMLLSMPGLKPVATLPSGPVRGLYESSVGRVFCATATTLYELFAGWSFLPRGTIPTGTTPVSFADDGIHVVLSVEGTGLAYELATDTLTTIVPGEPTLVFGQLAYIDGRILTNAVGTRRFYYTDILNAPSWPVLNYYSAEGRPDLLVTLAVDHREVYLFGSQSIEIWGPTGDALSPFALNQSVFIEQGIESPWAVESLDNSLYWLGGSARGEGPMWTFQGYTPQRISTHAVESAMARMPTVGDCITSAARHGGHGWVVFHFPAGGATWAYDTATQSWAEWPALAEDGALLAYPCQQHCPAFGEHLWGSKDSAALFIWDPHYHRLGMGTRLCRRTSPHVRSEQKRLRYREFRLEAQAGTGLDAGVVPGTVPQAMLRTSTDGGESWSYGRWRSLGRIGARRHQACWLNLGQARAMAFEVSISDPVFVALLGASLEVG